MPENPFGPRVVAKLDTKCRGYTNEAICVTFPYDRTLVRKANEVDGSRWSKIAKHWHVPLEADTCRQLRKVFGDELSVHKSLAKWYRDRDKHERQMHIRAEATSGNLSRLWDVMPALARAIHLGPRGRFMTPEERAEALREEGSYQVADVQFLVSSTAPINGNEQGLGKTLEWIATVWEQGLEEGDHLVLAPRSAVEGTWGRELRNWHRHRDDVEIFTISDTGKAEQETLEAWRRSTARVRWLVMNPAKLRAQKDKTRASDFTLRLTGVAANDGCYCNDRTAHEHYKVRAPDVLSADWSTVCIDEAHKEGIKNPKSVTANTLQSLRAEKLVLMSGTPMAKLGGHDLWGLLHFQHPKRFGSYWNFVDKYFNIEENHFGKKVGTLRKDREEDLFRTLSPFMLRRLKSEVFAELPEKIYVEVECVMTKRQAQQYRMMENEAWTRSGRDRIEGLGTLPQRTRLRQLANGHCRIGEDDQIYPIDSPKVDKLIDNLKDIDGKHLVFTRSKLMAEFAAQQIADAGFDTGLLSGKTKADERERLIDGMQVGGLEVLVIVTTAGGTSLTLDQADTVHFIDESDNPSDDEQAEDRAHRVSNIHQVTIYVYRTLGTIDFDVAVQKEGKSASHRHIMDERRRITSAFYEAETA